MAAPGVDPREDAFWNSRTPVVLANPRDPVAVDAARAAADAPAGEGSVCFLTSGSSGHPKLVAFDREALLASARAVNSFLGLTASDVWLRVLPRFHVGGFQVEARAWAAGARSVVQDDRWDAPSMAARCAAERVTVVSLVPTQVHDLVQAGVRAPAPLHTVLVGGGELRPGLAAAARALGWPVLASYGLTEAASSVAIQSAEEPDCTRLTVLPHWRATIDADGRLALEGPALPRAIGQWDPESRRYRWLPVSRPMPTNDRVQLDGSTMIFLGRADRVVKRLGELIDLALAERGLADAALAAGVFGRVHLRGEPDPRDGWRLVVECLVRSEGEAVAARFNALQPPFARVSEVREVEDLRVSALGKPLR